MSFTPRKESGSAGAGGFENVRSAWRALRGNARYFFQTSEWVELIAQRVDGDITWGVLIDDDGPAAVSILRRSRRRVGGVNLKILSEVRIGDSGAPFADGLVDAEAHHQRRFGDVLDFAGSWHVLRLGSLRAESPWLKVAPGWGDVRDEPDGGVGVLHTDREIDDLWRASPKNIRNSIRKAQRRIDGVGGVKVIVSTGAEVATAYEQFVSLEASGWKGKRGTALAQTPDMKEMLRDYLLASSTARVRSLYIDDRLAASQLSVTIARTLFLMKVAYDEQLADLSPGNILMANLVEACCRDPEVDRIDCTVWEPWHQRWGMVREPTYRLVAFNGRSVRGIVGRTIWNGRRLAHNRWPEAEVTGSPHTDQGTTPTSTAPNLSVRPIAVREIADIESGWRELEGRANQVSMYATFDWLAAWAEVYRPKQLLSLRVVGAEGETAALGLIELDRLRGWSFAGGAVTPQRSLLCAADFEHYAWETLGRWLRENSREWSSLEGSGVPLEAVEDWLPNVQLHPQVSMRLELPQSFDAYLKDLPGRRRNTIRKKLRRLDEEQAEVRAVPAGEREVALADFLRFHHARASSKGESHPNVDRHLADLLARFACDGAIKLRMFELRHGGSRVGVQVRLDHANVAYLYNLGFEPRVEFLSPGVVLVLHTLDDAMKSGLLVADLGLGEQTYKSELGALPVEHTRIAASNSAAWARAIRFAYASYRRTISR